MKFAKELDENAIPEWKNLYFDYKTAKKKLKAVARAARNVGPANSPLSRRAGFANNSSLRDTGPVLSFLNAERSDLDGQDDNRQHPLRPGRNVNERSPLRSGDNGEGAPQLTRYGSIIGSPPSGNSPLQHLSPQRTQASLLELPDPILASLTKSHTGGQGGGFDPIAGPPSPETLQAELQHPDATRRQFAHIGNAYEVGQTTDGDSKPVKSSRFGFMLSAKRSISHPGTNTRTGLAQRVLSATNVPYTTRTRPNDVALEAYREADFRQAEFFLFLDQQLDKIEKFYKTKETEATERLRVLREQLHMLRNRRLQEIMEDQQRHQHKHHNKSDEDLDQANGFASYYGHNPDNQDEEVDGDANGEAGNGDLQPDQHPHQHRWHSVASQVENTLTHVRTGRVGKTSQAMGELGTPSNSRLDPSRLDYTKRQDKEVVPPYRAAKRKLKTALQEYYRGLELLKSYALLNRTAYRKINKKYDKTLNIPSGGTMRYMTEKINKAHFVNSDIVEGHLQAVEDLYSRYFERGNRKVAIGKLRGKIIGVGDYTGTLCRTGFFLGSGIVLAVQGIVYGILDLYDPDPTIHIYTSYLLQFYAGYFEFLFLMGLFSIAAAIFTRAKVRYQFVFEFSKNALDWRQLCEIPAAFFFLLAFAMYFNFTLRLGGEVMYIYWPVVLVGLSVILMFLPPPLFFYEARHWMIYSCFRLLGAGLFSVEFRDFFLGDMFCSQTYALGNMELFFCFYTKSGHPDTLPTCSSSNSRLLGFFSTLPGIVRALQCVRRYYDTRAIFPHLVNFGKYCFTILQYMTLSLFRINKTHEMKALFIACSTINAVYCSIWDIAMDWSLGSPRAKYPLLRDELAYKRHRWYYYLAMIVDPILRFNWVFYAIFADDAQHSSIISFSVATSEVFRRGMWTLIRVENEHCTNVSRNRAARDVELPYQRTSPELIAADFDGAGGRADAGVDDTIGDEETAQAGRTQDAQGADSSHTTTTAQAQTPSSASFLRQRRQTQESPVSMVLRRVGSAMGSAHAQDYVKRKAPTMQEVRDSDEDDDEDEAETHEAEELRERAGGAATGRAWNRE